MSEEKADFPANASPEVQEFIYNTNRLINEKIQNTKLDLIKLPENKIREFGIDFYEQDINESRRIFKIISENIDQVELYYHQYNWGFNAFGNPSRINDVLFYIYELVWLEENKILNCLKKDPLAPYYSQSLRGKLNYYAEYLEVLRIFQEIKDNYNNPNMTLKFNYRLPIHKQSSSSTGDMYIFSAWLYEEFIEMGYELEAVLPDSDLPDEFKVINYTATPLSHLE